MEGRWELNGELEKSTARDEKKFEYFTLTEPFLSINLALFIDERTRSTVLHSTIHVSLLLHQIIEKNKQKMEEN